MDVGQKIVNLRIDQNMTQKELAQRAGISPAALSKIEAGANRPTSKVLQRLARCLGVSTDYLLDSRAPYPPPAAVARGGKDRPRLGEINLSSEEYALIQALRRRGGYWREVALALPHLNADTVRLIRILLRRESSAKPAKKTRTGKRPAGKPARKKAKKSKAKKKTGKRKKRKIS